MAFALITGASKGIGRSIAIQLSRRGKDVLLVARNAAMLEQAAAEIASTCKVKALYLATDLSHPDAAQQVFDWCRDNNYTVDVLVNNAGYGLSGPFESHKLEDHMNMVQLNTLTVVRLCHLFLPVLRSQPKAYILNIASSAAYQATPFLGLYSASKSFVLLFSRALSRELRGTPVSVTCVNPGSTDTDFVDRALVKEKGRDLAKKVNMTPDAVAKIAVDSMYSGKTEVITGFINKLGAFLAWLLPKKLVENSAAKIYQ